MKRFLVLGATLGLAAVVTPAASPAKALCVGARPGCYSTIKAAVDAASDRPPSDSDANQLVPGDQVVLPAGDLGNLKLEGVHHTSTPSPSRRPDVPCTYAVRHTTGFAEIGGLVV